MKVQKDFMSAYFHAYSIATKYIGYKIEILMETGFHYITRQYMDEFIVLQNKNIDVDFSNPSFDMVIKPLGCEIRD